MQPDEIDNQQKSAWTGRPRLSIIMPVRNDAPSVNIMVRVLSALVEVPHELIVVYDDPSDTTVPIVQALQKQQPQLIGLLNTNARGVFNAVSAGVRASRGRTILIYAADEIGPVLAVGQMLELIDGGCQLVSATRYAKGGRRLGGSRLGHALSRTANAMFCLLSSTALTDCTTGIKMFQRDIFETLAVEGRGGGWSFAFEMAVRAQLANLRVGEVPIVSIDRLFGGESTFRLLPWMMSYGKSFLWGIWQLPPWRRPRPKLYRPLIGEQAP